MSVYVNGTQVGYVTDYVSYMLPVLGLVIMVFIIIALVRELKGGL